MPTFSWFLLLIIHTGYLVLELYVRKIFKVSLKILDVHLWATAVAFIWSSHLILNLSCEAADWKLLITLNACSVFFLKEGHQQMSWLLYCGTWRLCVGFREQAVVSSFCWLHPLLPLPRQMWLTVRGFVWQAAPWWSISKFKAVTPSFSLSPDLITLSPLLSQVHLELPALVLTWTTLSKCTVYYTL